MLTFDRSLAEFVELGKTYIKINWQAAVKQQALLEKFVCSDEEFIHVDDVREAVVQRMQQLFEAEKEVAISGDGEAIQGLVVQSLQGRMVRLRCKLNRMAMAADANPESMLSRLRFHHQVMLYPYRSLKTLDGINPAYYSLRRPYSFIGAFKLTAQEIMAEEMESVLRRMPAAIQRKDARRIAGSELNFICKEVERAWKWHLDAKRTVVPARPVKHKNDGFFGRDSVAESLSAFTAAASGAVDAKTEKHCGPVIRLCQTEDLRKCLQSLGHNNKINPVDKEILDRLTVHDGMVRHVPVPADFKKILADFRLRFPNMAELAGMLERQFLLLTLGNDSAPVRIANGMLILDGPPGSGKTVAVRYLAKRLGVGMLMFGFAEKTNGFDISGQSRGWSSGKMGMVARQLIERRIANPMIVIDEIDKATAESNNFPPYQPLYTLLERESAAHFRDEYLDFEMDASRINWLATSNYYDQIPEPIRDRARRITVSQPDEMQRISIIQHIYSDMVSRHQNGWGRFFVAAMPVGVAFMLASIREVSVRKLVDVVEMCIVEAAGRCAGKDVSDLTISENDAVRVIRRLNLEGGDKTSIGFIH